MGNFCNHPREQPLQRNTSASFMFQNSYKTVAFENESGDICDQKVDAIINVANNQLAHRNGLANTIVMKGGQVIQDESNKIVQETDGILEIGTAAVTTAGNLPAKHIIHVVSPIWNGGENGEEEKLAIAVINALTKADEKKITSIAVPSLSGGSFGFPKEKCAAIMVKNCMEYIDNNPETSIKLIRFVNMESSTVKAFKSELESVMSSSTSPASPEKALKVDEEEERQTEEITEVEETKPVDEVKVEEPIESAQVEEEILKEEVAEEKEIEREEKAIEEIEKAEENAVPEENQNNGAEEQVIEGGSVREEEAYLEKSPSEPSE